MDIKITKVKKCISLLCSLLDSLYSLVMVIGISNAALNIDDVVTSLLSKEMRQNYM